jgi:hypothetical protein
MNEEQFKKACMEAWDMYIEPLFKDGSVTFECSDRLREHLIKTANGEYSDDQIIKFMEDGEI